MRDVRKLGGVVAALVILSVLPSAPVLAAAAPQSAELWGGPGAKGTGLFGATFDTTIYVGAAIPAEVTIDFFQNGALAATVGGSIAAQGVAAFSAPSVLTNQGAFFYRVTSNVAVTAWSETFNSTANGQFGLSVDAFLAADFLHAGDEATGVGAEATTSTAPGRARTNVGIFCNPGSSQACRMEVAAFNQGTLLGTGTIEAVPGATTQRGLADLIPGAAEHVLLTLRLRVLSGNGAPYAIKNHNDTSDAARIPLTTTRFAFSTAPVVTSFDVSPASGCSPQQVTLSWATTGAARVTISGVAGDLSANGSTSITLLTTTDLVLTAYAPTGETTSVPRHVTVLQPTQAPTPSPSSGTVTYGQTISGLLPPINGITAQFVQQQSAGSTFTVNGSIFLYVAGTTAGTDIVRLTLTGPCGPATADFTATVIAPGSPQILSFTSDPMVGCNPANIVLGWLTKDVRVVAISGIDFTLPANGAYGLTIDATTDFTLTAFGFAGQKVTAKLTVRVDNGLQTPIVTPSIANVPPFSSLLVTATGVDDPSALHFNTIKAPSGGYLQQTSPGHFTYYSGGAYPTQDVFQIVYRNGCGSAVATFTANVAP